MKCPNCGKEMEKTYDYIWCQEDIDESCYIESGFHCKSCDISYVSQNGEWVLPSHLQITEKQHRAIMFIANRLEIRPEEYPITKKQAIKFISKYLTLATKITLDYPDDWDEYQCDYYFALND